MTSRADARTLGAKLEVAGRDLRAHGLDAAIAFSEERELRQRDRRCGVQHQRLAVELADFNLRKTRW